MDRRKAGQPAGWPPPPPARPPGHHHHGFGPPEDPASAEPLAKALVGQALARNEESLRERKKQRTRAAIADAAAALFAEHGFEAVTVADVAQAADVSEQTVYNYFPTKEHLVFDQADEVETVMLEQIRQRSRGTSRVSALRQGVLRMLDELAESRTDDVRGGAVYLIATSQTLRHWHLAVTNRCGERLAGALAEEVGDPKDDPAARVVANALLGAYQVCIDELGRRMVAGEEPREIVATLRPAIERAFDCLELGLWSYGSEVEYRNWAPHIARRERRLSDRQRGRPPGPGPVAR